MSPKREILNHDESAIRKDILTMSRMVDDAIERAVESLSRGDMELAARVVEEDRAINDLQGTIEQESLVTIATQQPVASDLRVVVGATHIAVELERIADHAVAIAKTLLDTRGSFSSPAIESLVKVAGQCRDILTHAMASFETMDAAMAYEAAKQDDAIDAAQRQINDLVIGHMCKDHAAIETDSRLLWVAHDLERVGDRAANIAERVIFMVEGKNVELNA
jgi:phosphate transport system protein